MEIGTDLVEVQRMARSLRHSRFMEEVFGPQERAYCGRMARPEQHYAARFAAKEAFLKALRIGIFSGVKLNEIQVVNQEGGAPRLSLGPSAVSAIERALEAHGTPSGIPPDRWTWSTRVSLSHVPSMAIATVVILGEASDGTAGDS